jgi:hypothetical protein
MSPIYERQMNGYPFFIIPNGRTNEEASIAFSHSFLTRQNKKRNQKKIPDILYSSAVNKVQCPIFSQVIFYDSGVLLSTTIKTEVLNVQTQRNGLNFVYGAFVKSDVFLLKTNVCSTVFEILDNYIQSFDSLIGIEAVSKIVTEFQVSDHPDDIYFNREDTERLLNYFESRFCLTDRKKINFISKIIISMKQSKILKQEWLKPCMEFEETKEFWRYMDGQLS